MQYINFVIRKIFIEDRIRYVYIVLDFDKILFFFLIEYKLSYIFSLKFEIFKEVKLIFCVVQKYSSLIQNRKQSDLLKDFSIYVIYWIIYLLGIFFFLLQC